MGFDGDFIFFLILMGSDGDLPLVNVCSVRTGKSPLLMGKSTISMASFKS